MNTHYYLRILNLGKQKWLKINEDDKRYSDYKPCVKNKMSKYLLFKKSLETMVTYKPYKLWYLKGYTLCKMLYSIHLLITKDGNMCI